MKSTTNVRRLRNLAVGTTLFIVIAVGAVDVVYSQGLLSHDDVRLSKGIDCDNGSLDGKYAVVGDGSVRFGGPGAPMVLFSTVSLLSMDGHGGLTNKVTRSIDGNISRGLDPGSYTVNADCTGTMTIGALTFDLVIAELTGKRTGRLFYFVATTPGGVVTATARRVD